VSSSLVLALPALAALGYVAAVLLLKNALNAGCRQSQVNLAANLVPAGLFQMLWLVADRVDWSEMWRPALATVSFLIGQIFTFRALRAGEVSVATPLLGTKVLLTAVFSALLFGQAIAATWWIGAAASTMGVVLVTGATWRLLAPRLRKPDAMYSLGAAAFFGLTDVLVQHWARSVGIPAFVAVMFGLVGVASLFLFLPGEGRRIFTLPGAAWAPLLIGSTVLGVQALGMAVALGLHESATAVNIVYSSRAVWSVVFAWLVARIWSGDEAHDSAEVMRRRLAGAVLLFAAVVVVLI
jgi:drug/metabolite transporter (DMT)-like permease